MQVKNILCLLSVLNSVNAFPKQSRKGREIELRNDN